MTIRGSFMLSTNHLRVLLKEACFLRSFVEWDFFTEKLAMTCFWLPKKTRHRNDLLQCMYGVGSKTLLTQFYITDICDLWCDLCNVISAVSAASAVSTNSVLLNLLTKGIDTNWGYKLKDCLAQPVIDDLCSLGCFVGDHCPSLCQRRQIRWRGQGSPVIIETEGQLDNS